jgi:uncharacterized protein
MIGVDTLVSDQDTGLMAFFNRVYGWMALALGVSALVAWQSAQSDAVVKLLVQNPGLVGFALILEIVVVLALTFLMNRMSTIMAGAMLILYAALNGFTFSILLLAYSPSSVAEAFGVTGITFMSLALYGFFTKRNLGAWGGFLLMSLIGLVLASLVGLFLNSPFIDFIVTYGGIIVFSGLVAYDNQKLKAYYFSGAGGGNLAIYGALSLYLDFINLFLRFLRIFGRRR